MADIVINRFPGIAPRLRSAEAGAITNAKIAENVDLYGETLRPFKGNDLVESGHSGPEMFFFGPEATGVWESGKENYLSVTQNGDDILIFKDPGDNKFKRKINGVTNLLGIVRPTAPSLLSLALVNPTSIDEIQEIEIDTIPTAVSTSAPPSEELFDRFLLDFSGTPHANWDGLNQGELAEFNGTTWQLVLPKSLARKEYVYFITFTRFANSKEIEGPRSIPLTVSSYPVETALSQTTAPNFAAVTVYVTGDQVLFTLPALGNTSTDQPQKFLYSAKVGFTSATNFDANDWTLIGDTTQKNNRFHRLTRPPIVDAQTEYWNVYRSDNGDTAQLISTGTATGIGENADYISDQKTSAGRGRKIDFLRNNEEDEPYRFEYITTWIRDTGGFIDESGPSEPNAIRIQTPGAKVTRSTSVPAAVTKWRVYRISTDFDPTTGFKLVAELDIGTTFFEDAFLNEDLGDLITTTFETESGEAVSFDAPEVDFEGMSRKPHYGMLFGWKDDRLYFSEPGNIDAWPVFNKKTAMGTIIGVEPNGGELLVMTKSGVQRLVGTDPEKVYLASAITDDGAVTRRGITSYKSGTVYLSDSGLVLISGANAQSITDELLGEEFFRTIDSSTVFLDFNDGILYIFHDAGMILYDTRIGQFTTKPDIFVDSHRINLFGLLYAMDGSGNIKSLHSSGDDEIAKYKTGELVLSNPEEKRFRKIEFTGSGVAEVEVFIDGVSVVTQTIDMDATLRDRQVNLPAGQRGRAAQISTESEGEIKEMRVEVFDFI